MDFLGDIRRAERKNVDIRNDLHSVTIQALTLRGVLYPLCTISSTNPFFVKSEIDRIKNQYARLKNGKPQNNNQQLNGEMAQEVSPPKATPPSYPAPLSPV